MGDNFKQITIVWYTRISTRKVLLTVKSHALWTASDNGTATRTLQQLCCSCVCCKNQPYSSKEAGHQLVMLVMDDCMRGQSPKSGKPCSVLHAAAAQICELDICELCGHGSMHAKPCPHRSSLEWPLHYCNKKSSKRHKQPLLLLRSPQTDSCIEMRQ